MGEGEGGGHWRAREKHGAGAPGCPFVSLCFVEGCIYILPLSLIWNGETNHRPPPMAISDRESGRGGDGLNGAPVAVSCLSRPPWPLPLCNCGFFALSIERERVSSSSISITNCCEEETRRAGERVSIRLQRGRENNDTQQNKEAGAHRSKNVMALGQGETSSSAQLVRDATTGRTFWTRLVVSTGRYKGRDCTLGVYHVIISA